MSDLITEEIRKAFDWWEDSEKERHEAIAIAWDQIKDLSPINAFKALDELSARFILAYSKKLSKTKKERRRHIKWMVKQRSPSIKDRIREIK